MAYVGTAGNTGDDTYTLASIIQGEAGNQGPQGMQAVANVIANRAATNWGNNGTSLVSQATAKNQFQGQARPSAAALQTAATLLTGTLPDITGGATSYANPAASSAKWARNLNDSNSLKIGDHYFTDNQDGQPFAPSPLDTGSTYDKEQAKMAAQVPPDQLGNLVKAYQSGQMPPAAKAQFERFVHDGTIMLPSNVKIGGAPTNPNGPQPVMLPQSTVDAYNKGAVNPYDPGAMPDSARRQMDSFLQDGSVALPSGAVLNPHYMGMAENIAEKVTGNLRSTPQTQAAGNYYEMPEENQGGAAGVKTAIGSTLASDPAEIVKIIKANFPNVGVSQDAKGNYLLKSAVDGKTYAIKPGMDAADVMKIAANVIPFIGTDGASALVGQAAKNTALKGVAAAAGDTLAGQVASGAVKAGVTQAGLEAAKGASGGDVSLGSIAAATGLGAAAPIVGKAASAAYDAVKGAKGAGAAASAPGATSAADLAADAAQGDADIAARERLAALNEKASQGAALTTAEHAERSTLMQKIAADEAAPAAKPGMENPPAPSAPKVAASEAQPEAPTQAPKSPASGPAEPAATEVAEGEAAPSGEAAAPNAGTPPPRPLPWASTATTDAEKESAAGLIGAASRNEPGAAERLTTIAQPNQNVIEAAKALGTDSHLDLGMVADNKSVRELQGGMAAIQGSAASAARTAAIEGQAQKAHQVIQALEGTRDVSEIGSTGKQILTDAQNKLQGQADSAYNQLKVIPQNTPAPATDTLDFINQRAAVRNGVQNLSPEEKMIVQKLAPKQVAAPEPAAPVPDPATGKITRQQFNEYNQAKKQWEANGGKIVQEPTHVLLDDVRKDIGRALSKKEGPFKDADRALLSQLYDRLTSDQGRVAETFGLKDVWNVGKRAVAERKAIETRLTNLFGDKLNETIHGQLNSAVNELRSGGSAKLVELLNNMPQEMKQRVTATALYSAMTRNAEGGAINFNDFTKFYEALARNKQTFNAVMSNLPEGAATQLNHLYTIAASISRANKDVVRTGVIQGLTDKFQGPDSLLSKLYGIGAHVAANSHGIASAAGIGHMVGLPGAGEAYGVGKAIWSALKDQSTKPDVLKSVDKFVASPEFRASMVQHASGDTKGAASKLAYSRPMLKFVRAMNNPREMTDKEAWIRSALEAKNNSDSSNTEPKK